MPLNLLRALRAAALLLLTPLAWAVSTPAAGPIAYRNNGTPNPLIREIVISGAATNDACQLNGAGPAFLPLPIRAAAINGEVRYTLNHCIPQPTAASAEIVCSDNGATLRYPLNCPVVTAFRNPVPDSRLCRIERAFAGTDIPMAEGMSLDGRYVLSTRVDPANTRIDPRSNTQVREIFVLDRSSNQVRQLTTQSAQTYDLALWRENGTLTINSLASVTFPVVNGQQIQQILGSDQPTLQFSASLQSLPSTGLETPAPGLRLLSETPNGHRLFANLFAGSVPLSMVLVDPAGQSVDLGPLIQAATSLTQPILAQDLNGSSANRTASRSVLSGDARRLVFSSFRILLGRGAGTVLPAGGVRERVYTFDIPSRTLSEVAVPNTDLSFPLNSIFSFTRFIGRTGSVLTLDRPFPFVGTPGNVDGTSEIYLADSQGNITQLTNSGVTLAQSPFNSSLASITYDESAVIFQSSENLAGNNPTRDQQLFRYDINTRTIRQVNNERSTFASVTAGAPVTANLSPQTTAIARDASGRVLIIQATGIVGASGNATGIRVGRSLALEIYVCD
jgi:hypothetical protein